MGNIHTWRSLVVLPHSHLNNRQDPRQTSHDGDPLMNHIRKKDLPVTLASLNYRLSPAVQHPSHQEDVIAAIAFLKEQYGMREYILVGHSAGACLAFQSAHIPGCKGIIGAEGIYDLIELVNEYPEYRGFVEGAFGQDRKVWSNASPTNIVSNLSSIFTVQLIHSTEDQLLTPRQTELMFSELQKTSMILHETAWIKGTHDKSISTLEFCTIVYNFIVQILDGN